MNNPIQNINEIAPVKEGQKSEGGSDSVQKEYLEGKGLLERNEPAMAAAALHNALLGFEEQGDDNGIANASNQLGHACVQRGEYEQAMKHYLRAEETCRKLGDPLSILSLSRQVIDVCSKTGEYKEALSRCLDILDLYQANNNPKGAVEILEVMAEIYLKDEEPTMAADAYATIASIHRNFKHEKIASEYLAKAEAVGKQS